MPDPLTSTLRLTEPTIGGDTGLWAGYLNNNMIFTDQGVNQTISVSIPDTNVTLIVDGTTSDQARYHAYNFTGALTANRTVSLPNVQRQGWATNNTTGGFNVILSAGAGTALALLPDGIQRFYVSDGSTNVTVLSVGFGTGYFSGAVTVASGGLTVSAGGMAVTGIVNAMTFISTNTDPAGNGVTGLAIGSGTLSVYSGSAGGTLRVANAAGGTGGLLEFFNGVGGNVGSITTNGSVTAFNTTSDERLKTKIGRVEFIDAAEVINRVAALWFTWKANQDDEPEPGFFAQQVYRVCPWAVTKGRGSPGSRNFVPWKMDASRLMPFVIAYIQGLDKRIARLERGA